MLLSAGLPSSLVGRPCDHGDNPFKGRQYSGEVILQAVRCGSPKLDSGTIYLASSLIQPMYASYAETFYRLVACSLCSLRKLLLEIMALRQQLNVFKGRPLPVKAHCSGQTLWVVLRRFWPGWKNALVIVHPETVVAWHRAGFKLYWTWCSRHKARAGRKCVSKEMRELIFRMVAENPSWGAPRIHGELQMLGFDLSKRTVSRWMRKAPRNPEPNSVFWCSAKK
jgi:hypothetical protein